MYPCAIHRDRTLVPVNVPQSLSFRQNLFREKKLLAGENNAGRYKIEFLEWTTGDRLRPSKFVALRDDKNPREVVKEHFDVFRVNNESADWA
jgi:hypothetical protein